MPPSSRKQTLRPEVLKPNSILLEFEGFASRAAGEAVTLEFNLDPAVHPVNVDATEFQAAILNLVTNARDALPNCGDIRLESRNVRLDGTDTRAPRASRLAIMSCSRSAIARDWIAPETQAKAFEPFFTTKSVGQESGLGLSKCSVSFRARRGTAP